MSIYDSKLWKSDLDEVVNAFPELDSLSGKTVMVTGCTGLICSAVVDVLIRWNERHDRPISIIAAGRNPAKITSRFMPYVGKPWFRIVAYDSASSEISLDMPCDYIIHGAGNASPNNINKEPVETMLSNFLGMRNLLEYARDNEVRRILYISSSEIYGKKEGNEPYRTDEYGYIDLMNPRNSYSVGKRAAETLCVSYASEYGTDSVIVRPGHIYGPTAMETDDRVSSLWSWAAARQQDIVMKSAGLQIRSYCHCLDCASAILIVLIKGMTCQAYNISNPDSIITIRDMAEMLTKTAGVSLKTSELSEAEKRGYNPMSNSTLDSTELLELGWRGLFDASKGFSHTVTILRESFHNN